MRSHHLKTYLVVFIALLSISFGSVAAKKQKAMSQQELGELTQSISKALEAEYIFPDVAKEISKVLKKNHEKGEYGKYADRMELSERLTNDIRSVNGDRHLSVRYTKASGGMRMMMRGGPGGANPQMVKRLARDNFGFESVKVLEGNVGYVNLTSMQSPMYAGETAAAAMQYLYNTDAIIFDLRENRGGAGEMYQFLASYFFDEGAIKLNEIYWPSEDRRYQIWTLPHLPGKRMPNKDLYILTSSNTGSAAEMFSYTLKHYDRATIVGETTVGIANPVSPTTINDEFMVIMSKGESKHPISKTNFEGKGVIPHVATSRTSALDTAHAKALEKLVGKSENDKGYYKWYHEIVSAKSASPEIDSKTLNSFEGTYVSQSGEQRLVKVNNGKLWYGSSEGQLTQMKAITSSRFVIPGDNSFKLEMNIEQNKVTGINRLFSTGRVIPMQKINKPT